MKRHIYTLPVKGAAPLAIVATQPTRRVLIHEDDAAAEQGIVLFYPDDKFTQGYTYAGAKQPVAIGQDLARGRGRGNFVGMPIQKDAGGTVTLSPATTLFKATSATATATSIVVEEYD